MPFVFSHAGLDTLDFTPGAIRTEFSDALYASLYLRPNFLAVLPIGQYGGGGAGVGASAQILAHFWPEDRLNPRQVTDLTAGGQTATSTTMIVSLADASILDIGYVLQDNSQNSTVAELVQVTGKQPGTPTATQATLTLTRGFVTTPTATHAASAVWKIIARPIQQNADLGIDMSRSPGVKSNLIQSLRGDVNISAAILSMAQFGFVPGIPNMLGYQIHQRFLEALQDLENTFLSGIGTPAATTTDFQTMFGLLSWLGMASVNANATASTVNANGAAITDFLINQVAINIYNQGAEIPDAIVAAPIVIDRIGRIYRDQLRLRQDELIRGYFVDAIRVSIGVKPVRLIMTAFMPAPVPPATTPQAIAAFVSLDRHAIIPFLDQFAYLISAPSFRDGDAMSFLVKCTYEPRNTGTDFGFANQALFNFSVA